MIFGIRSPRGALLLACVVLGGLPTASGCSYLFVTPPRSEYGGLLAADCTTNAAAPVIDTLLTTTNLVSTLIVGGEDNVKNRGQAVGVGLLATGFWLSSAIYGFYNTNKCTELRTDEGQGPYHHPVRLRRTVLSGPGGPQPVPPPPLPSSATLPAPPSPQAYPVPPPYPPTGGGAVGGAAGTVTPATPPIPARPPVRQQLDQDDPG